MHERNFVMRPLWDLDTTLEVPGWDPERALGDVRSLGPL
jgi:7,8-dihydro-6-hydroxymethylpterin-pyrophosphokinase